LAKDLITLIDGTGNQPGDRESTDSDTHVTNVGLLAEALEDLPGDQVVRYCKGIATSGWRLPDFFSFNFGLGWNRKCNEARRFVRARYEPGDRLFIIGFSRGAAIARDLANRLADQGIPTYALLLFDSVGAFGLPTKLPGIPQEYNLGKRLDIPSTTRHVHHAIALDEVREPFTPTLCCSRDGLELEEVWFAGDHANVGGGRKARALSDVTLRWAIDRLSRHQLRFRPDAEWMQSIGLDPGDVIRRSDYPRIRLREVRCHRRAPPGTKPKVHRSVEALIEKGYQPLRLKLPLEEHYDVVD